MMLQWRLKNVIYHTIQSVSTAGGPLRLQVEKYGTIIDCVTQ